MEVEEALQWSPLMERKLAEFTRMHMFDFNKVSADMQRYMTSQQFSRPDLFTSDVCRVHFAMMDFQQSPKRIERLSDSDKSPAGSETAIIDAVQDKSTLRSSSHRTFVPKLSSDSDSSDSDNDASPTKLPFGRGRPFNAVNSTRAPSSARQIRSAKNAEERAPQTLHHLVNVATATVDHVQLHEARLPSSESHDEVFGLTDKTGMRPSDRLLSDIQPKHTAAEAAAAAARVRATIEGMQASNDGPSDFSIFTHSLKDRFEEIFAQVRSQLPAITQEHQSVDASDQLNDSRTTDGDDEPIDVAKLKRKLIEPLIQSMNLVSAVDAEAWFSEMEVEENLANKTTLHDTEYNITNTDNAISNTKSTRGINMDLLGGIDLDALLHSLERGSSL